MPPDHQPVLVPACGASVSSDGRNASAQQSETEHGCDERARLSAAYESNSSERTQLLIALAELRAQDADNGTALQRRRSALARTSPRPATSGAVDRGAISDGTASQLATESVDDEDTACLQSAADANRRTAAQLRARLTQNQREYEDIRAALERASGAHPGGSTPGSAHVPYPPRPRAASCGGSVTGGAWNASTVDMLLLDLKARSSQLATVEAERVTLLHTHALRQRDTRIARLESTISAVRDALQRTLGSGGMHAAGHGGVGTGPAAQALHEVLAAFADSDRGLDDDDDDNESALEWKQDGTSAAVAASRLSEADATSWSPAADHLGPSSSGASSPQRTRAPASGNGSVRGSESGDSPGLIIAGVYYLLQHGFATGPLSGPAPSAQRPDTPVLQPASSFKGPNPGAPEAIEDVISLFVTARSSPIAATPMAAVPVGNRVHSSVVTTEALPVGLGGALGRNRTTAVATGASGTDRGPPAAPQPAPSPVFSETSATALLIPSLQEISAVLSGDSELSIVAGVDPSHNSSSARALATASASAHMYANATDQPPNKITPNPSEKAQAHARLPLGANSSLQFTDRPRFVSVPRSREQLVPTTGVNARVSGASALPHSSSDGRLLVQLPPEQSPDIMRQGAVRSPATVPAGTTAAGMVAPAAKLPPHHTPDASQVGSPLAVAVARSPYKQPIPRPALPVRQANAPDHDGCSASGPASASAAAQTGGSGARVIVMADVGQRSLSSCDSRASDSGTPRSASVPPASGGSKRSQLQMQGRPGSRQSPSSAEGRPVPVPLLGGGGAPKRRQAVLVVGTGPEVAAVAKALGPAGPAQTQAGAAAALAPASSSLQAAAAVAVRGQAARAQAHARAGAHAQAQAGSAAAARAAVLSGSQPRLPVTPQDNTGRRAPR